MAPKLSRVTVNELIANVKHFDEKCDHEAAHSEEDKLMRRFIEHCTTSGWQPSEVRAMATQIHELTGDQERERWYA